MPPFPAARPLRPQVISRCVGVHKLLLLNFYPFLQKYIAPQQREVTHILAALVQVGGAGLRGRGGWRCHCALGLK